MKIEFKNISKTFGHVKANEDISFTIDSGTIHALIGENGAGKSTLIKILSGQIFPDHGSIMLDSSNIELGSTNEANEKGIGILGQDPLDFSNFTVLESFIAGHPSSPFVFSKKNIAKKINPYLTQFNWNIQLNSLVKDLSVGERQQLELIRLLDKGAKVIILDEPTSGFSLEQKKKVFETLKILSKNGFTIILVSHKIEEILEICSHATIMQKGRLVNTIDLPTDPQTLIDLMFGPQDISNKKSAPELNLDSISKINLNISDFSIKYNSDSENDTHTIDIPQKIIIGIAGLQGSGADKFIQHFQSNPNQISTSNKSYLDKSTITYVPADRLERGLFPDMTICEHIALAYNHKSTVDWNEMENLSQSLINKYGIVGTPNSVAKTLSGGNQQRLMLSLITESTELLLLEQPTRGLDIQSANYVWENLSTTKKTKTLTLFSSTDIDEIYAYSEYIICFFNDHIVAHGYPKDITKDIAMQKISGN